MKVFVVASGDSVHDFARLGRIVASSLSTSTRRLNTRSAISSWLPVPSSTGWMIGTKSEMRATRRTLAPSAGDGPEACAGEATAEDVAAAVAVAGVEVGPDVDEQADGTRSMTANIAETTRPLTRT